MLGVIHVSYIYIEREREIMHLYYVADIYIYIIYTYHIYISYIHIIYTYHIYISYIHIIYKEILGIFILYVVYRTILHIYIYIYISIIYIYTQYITSQSLAPRLSWSVDRVFHQNKNIPWVLWLYTQYSIDTYRSGNFVWFLHVSIHGHVSA